MQPAAWGVRAEPPKGVGRTRSRVRNVGGTGSGIGTGGEPPWRLSGRVAARRAQGGVRECERRRADAQPGAGAAGKGQRGECERRSRLRQNPDDGAGHDGGGKAGGGERSEPPGQAERGVSAANGGVRDTRPKGRDRVAGSAG